MNVSALSGGPRDGPSEARRCPTAEPDAEKDGAITFESGGEAVIAVEKRLFLVCLRPALVENTVDLTRSQFDRGTPPLKSVEVRTTFLPSRLSSLASSASVESRGGS